MYCTISQRCTEKNPFKREIVRKKFKSKYKGKILCLVMENWFYRYRYLLMADSSDQSSGSFYISTVLCLPARVLVVEDFIK